MKDLLKRCQMEGLKQADIEAYQQEIEKSWETQAEDIALLNDIIKQHGSETKSGNKSMQVGFLQHKEGVDINLPSWLVAAYDAFNEKYGKNYGSVILEKTLSQIWDTFVPAQPLELNTVDY